MKRDNEKIKKNTKFIYESWLSKISILATILSLSIGLNAQIMSLADTANFYDYMDAFYNSSSYNPNDTSEGGSRAQHNRKGMIWAPRLHPHGDFSVANKAIIDYSRNYTPISSNSVNPNWNCLGPSNTPSPNSKKGVGQIHRITFNTEYAINNQTIYTYSRHGKKTL